MKRGGGFIQDTVGQASLHPLARGGSSLLAREPMWAPNCRSRKCEVLALKPFSSLLLVAMSMSQSLNQKTERAGLVTLCQTLRKQTTTSFQQQLRWCRRVHRIFGCRHWHQRLRG